MDKVLEELKERLYTEISETLMKTKLDASSLEQLGYAVDIIKDICEIAEDKSEMKMQSYRAPMQGYGYSYSDGMVEKLKRMLNEATTEQERNAIYDCINRLH